MNYYLKGPLVQQFKLALTSHKTVMGHSNWLIDMAKDNIIGPAIAEVWALVFSEQFCENLDLGSNKPIPWHREQKSEKQK